MKYVYINFEYKYLFFILINIFEPWPIVTDINEEPDTNSRKDSEVTEPSTSPRIWPPSRSEILSMSLSMVPSTRACHTSTITEEPEPSSTWIPEPSALLLTNKSETESSPKDFTSESNTWSFQHAERSSWTDVKKTIE